MGGRTWRIVDMDYWYNFGYNALFTHHIVIMPDRALYTAKMNDTDVATGAYVGSKMYTQNLTEAKGIVNGAFSEAHVLSHQENLQNAINSNGIPSGSTWANSTVDLPNEIMMYGCPVYGISGGDGTAVPNSATISNAQLSGFRNNHRLLAFYHESFWLRDVASKIDFACVGNSGVSTANSASTELGVRPVFGIKG